MTPLMGADPSSLLDTKSTPEARKRSHALDISEVVWNRMQELGINQTQLAEKLGKSCSQVSRIISADGNITLQTISELEHVLGITLISIPPSETSKSADKLSNRQIVEVFLYQMEEYRKISSSSKLSKRTARLKLEDNPKLPNKQLSTSDYAAMTVRLMLQRKHFVFGDDIHVRDVIKAALELFPHLQDDLNTLRSRLDWIKQRNFETTHSDGRKTASYYHNAEEALYGILLHSDIQKIEHVADFSPEFLLTAITPFILERERVLYRLSDLLKSAGSQPYRAQDGHKAQVLRFTKSKPEDLQVTKSPRWSNLIARDGTPEELRDMWGSYDKNTREIIILCYVFIQLLRSEQLDTTALSQLVFPSTRESWGDFSQAAKLIAEYPNLGMSDSIEFFNLRSCAKAKLLPGVEELIIIDTPQAVSTWSMILRKHHGKWKVWGLAAS